MTDSTKQQIEELEARVAQLRKEEDEYGERLAEYADGDAHESAGPQKLGSELGAIKRKFAEKQSEREDAEKKLEDLRGPQGNA